MGLELCERLSRRDVLECCKAFRQRFRVLLLDAAMLIAHVRGHQSFAAFGVVVAGLDQCAAFRAFDFHDFTVTATIKDAATATPNASRIPFAEEGIAARD